MKLRILLIKQIILTILLIICFQQDAYSQGTDLSSGKRPGVFFGISMGPSQSHIINVGTSSVSGLLSTKKNSFSGSVDIGYFFSNYFGLSSGIGFCSYKTQLTLANYQSNFNTTDSEIESYERRVTGSAIKEEQKVGSLSVPFCINLRLPLNKSIGFFLETGVNFSVPLSKNYKSSGTFTYKGYYPAYNVLLENLPVYGFPTSKSSNAEGELVIKSFGLNAAAAAGIDFFIQKRIQIAIAACYNKSLSSISNYSSPDKFQLSSDAGQINSLMGGSSKATIQSMGLKISFRYYLK
ncbi:MAG: outer membrane beta-barrel protein [Bacteroidia bacterium]|nr:outer membrane beta-barrel protein [Bacteroidia bacterium]